MKKDDDIFKLSSLDLIYTPLAFLLAIAIVAMIKPELLAANLALVYPITVAQFLGFVLMSWMLFLGSWLFGKFIFFLSTLIVKRLTR